MRHLVAPVLALALCGVWGAVRAADSAPATQTTQTTQATQPALGAADFKPVALLGDEAFRHYDTVTKMQILSDGKRMLSSGHDGTVRLWELPGGKLLQTYKHDKARVWDFQVLPGEERMLATGEEQVVLWELATGKKLDEFSQGHMVFRMALDPAGKRFAAGDQDKRVLVWDLESKKIVATFRGGGNFYTVLFDNVGESLMAGCEDSTIHLFNVSSRQSRNVKDKDKDDQPENAQANPPPLPRLLPAIRRRNVGAASQPDSQPDSQPSSQPTSAASQPTSRPTAAAASQPADTPASFPASQPATMPIRRATSRPTTRSSSRPTSTQASTQSAKVDKTGDIFTLAPSPTDKTRILVCCGGRGPWLMDGRTGQEIWRAKDGTASYCAAWSPDGKTVLTMGNHDDTCLYDAADGSLKWKVRLPGHTQYGAGFSPDGKEALCGAANVVCRLDAQTGKRIYPAPDAAMQNEPAEDIFPIARSNLLLTRNGSDGIYIWDRQARKVEGVLLAGERPQEMSVSDDGKTILVTVTDNHVAKVIDRATGQTRTLDSGVNYVALSHDGRIAVLDFGQNLRVVHLDTDKRTDINKGDRYYGSRNVYISPDDSEIASWNNDSITIWAVSDGTMITNLTGLKDVRGCGYTTGKSPLFVAWTETELAAWSTLATEGQPLTEEQARELIGQLGSVKYATREEASKKLIAAGPSILPLLASTTSEDVETSERIGQIQKEIRTSNARYRRLGSVRLGSKSTSSFTAHPDGRHWAILQNESPNNKIMLGEVKDGVPSLIGAISTPHSPESCAFDDAGNLLVGNRNGTISVLSAGKPADAATQPER